MKGWEDWTHAQRAEFISHLNQPHPGLDDVPVEDPDPDAEYYRDTTRRAIAALNRPERFGGEHEVARAWLRDPLANREGLVWLPPDTESAPRASQGQKTGSLGESRDPGEEG